MFRVFFCFTGFYLRMILSFYRWPVALNPWTLQKSFTGLPVQSNSYLYFLCLGAQNLVILAPLALQLLAAPRKTESQQVAETSVLSFLRIQEWEEKELLDHRDYVYAHTPHYLKLWICLKRSSAPVTVYDKTLRKKKVRPVQGISFAFKDICMLAFFISSVAGEFKG